MDVFCGGDGGGQAEACWTGIPVATTQGEQSYIKGNTKYMAVAVQVMPLTSTAFLDFRFVSVIDHPGKRFLCLSSVRVVEFSDEAPFF